MSEEKTEVVQTIAAVSVRAYATAPESDSYRLEKMVVHSRRTATTLRVIVDLATKARDVMANQPIGQPPKMESLRVFECVEQILRMAKAAVNAHDKLAYPEAKKEPT